MGLVRTRSLILQTFRYGETSKILRLYTLDHGLRSVIAKGAHRAKNRFGGVLEPFTEGEAGFYLREGRDLHTLGSFDLLRSRQGIGRGLLAFAGASLVAELLLRFSTEEPQPLLYRVANQTLERLASAEDGDAALAATLAGVWHAVTLLGYQPELEHCVTCAARIPDDAPCRFDVDAGGAACTRCRRTGRVIDPVTRRQVLRMSIGDDDPPSITDRSLHRALLRTFLSAHLAPERPLRSLALFVELTP